MFLSLNLDVTVVLQFIIVVCVFRRLHVERNYIEIISECFIMLLILDANNCSILQGESETNQIMNLKLTIIYNIMNLLTRMLQALLTLIIPLLK